MATKTQQQTETPTRNTTSIELSRNREPGSLVPLNKQLAADLEARTEMAKDELAKSSAGGLWRNSPATIKAAAILIPLVMMLGKHPRVSLLWAAVIIMAVSSGWDWLKRWSK